MNTNLRSGKPLYLWPPKGVPAVKMRLQMNSVSFKTERMSINTRVRVLHICIRYQPMFIARKMKSVQICDTARRPLSVYSINTIDKNLSHSYPTINYTTGK